MNTNDIKNKLKKVIAIESKALDNLSEAIDDSFVEVVKLIRNRKGKVIITGVGKSGHIGNKNGSDFCKYRNTFFFLHSTEGVHGDLGMVTDKDVVILISNSGETQEVLSVLPSLDIIQAKKISITSNNQSTLAQNVDVALEITSEKEADHLNLAPTASSTLTLVIGDALAVYIESAARLYKRRFSSLSPRRKFRQPIN